MSRHQAKRRLHIVRKVERRYCVRTRLASCFCSLRDWYEKCHINRTYPALVPALMDGQVKETVIMTPGYCRRRRRALADQVQTPGEIMQGVESYWNPVGGERSGFCSRISGEPSTGGRARTCCQPRVVGWFILGMPCSWIDVRRYD